VVLTSTPSPAPTPGLRYYQFTGSPSFDAVFTSPRPVQCNEIRGGAEVASPDIVFYTTPRGSASAAASAAATGGSGGPSWGGAGARPDAFAMLTGYGVYAGRLALGGSVPAPTGAGAAADVVMLDAKMVAYPAPQPQQQPQQQQQQQQQPDGVEGGARSRSKGASGEATAEVPLGLAITEFHFLLLYRQRLIALSRVSYGVVFEQALPEDKYGTMRAIVTDPTGGGDDGKPKRLARRLLYF
jgi:hypothetical protein